MEKPLLPWLLPQPGDFRNLCRAVNEQLSDRGHSLRQLADYCLDGNGLHKLAQTVTAAIDAGLAAPLSRFTLALVSNGTTDFLSSALVASAARHGIALSIIAAPFGVTAQAAVDPAAGLLAEKPDAVLLALDYREFFGERRLVEGGEDLVEQAIHHLAGMVDSFGSATRANIIVQTLASPPERVFGSFDRKQPGTTTWLVSKFNARLCDEIIKPGVTLLDIEALAAGVGLDEWFDRRQWITARLPFAQRFLPLFGEHAARILGAMRGTGRKVLVLDLDNTIWGGVIGDDGIGGLRLGHGDAHGEAFVELQQAALTLKERGVVLAVCSKNEEATARAALRDHPEMLLRESDFAAMQINWLDKASNLEAIAKQLSLGLDSFVFFDDNPVERAQVRAALPQVSVPEISSDPTDYARTLLTAGLFEGIVFSSEDRERASQYAANARRETLLTTSRDLNSFLESLQMTATFTAGGAVGWQRFTQLINKSNQFNLTTQRHTETEILAMLSDPSMFLLQVKLHDRFGDNGMISAVICRSEGEVWQIDTWVMSCRVLNRRVEAAVLNEIALRAIAAGAKRMIGAFRPTARNELVRGHYQKLGFELRHATGEMTLWELDLTQFAPLSVPIETADPLASAA
jgi:FkbH-like protein